MSENEFEQRLIHAWTKQYIAGTAGGADAAEISLVIKGCHAAHYDLLGMDGILEPFAGRIEDFINFLQSQWNWIVRYDRETNVILADENKADCVCPLFQTGIVSIGKLCACSEGFAERMFAFVLLRPVRAEVVRSVIRDGQSCIYRITIGG